MYSSILIGLGLVVTAILSGALGIVLGGALNFRAVNEALAAFFYLVVFAVGVTMIFFGAGSAVTWIGLIFLGLAFGSVLRQALD